MEFMKTLFYALFTMVLLNSCAKEYSLEGGGLKIATGAWEFKDSLKQFQGNMDTAYITSSGGTKDLQLLGTSSDGFQTFHMHLYAELLQQVYIKRPCFNLLLNIQFRLKLFTRLINWLVNL